MSGNAVTWIGCAQAEILVNDLIGGDFDRHEAFLTLLKFTKAGLVRINATRFEMAYINSHAAEEGNTPLNAVVIGSADWEIFIDGIVRLYTHGIGEGEFLNFHVGAFEFQGVTIRNENHEDFLYANRFSVFGLKFSHEDILLHFLTDDYAPHRAKAILPNATLPAASSASVTSKASAVKECTDWLSQEFSASAVDDRTKHDFWKIASSKFQDRLSYRGFQTAWTFAAQAFPYRRLPGRKSVQRIDTPD